MTVTLERVVGRDEALRTALTNLGGRGSVRKGAPVHGSDIVTAERAISAQ